MVGIRDGFDGLMFPDRYGEAGTIGAGTYELTRDIIRGIGHLGGTVLGSTNRGNPVAVPGAGSGRCVDDRGSQRPAGRDVPRAPASTR